MKNKIENLINYTEFDQLKQYKKSTKRTDVGGDVLNESAELVQVIASVVNDAAFMQSLENFATSLKPAVKEKLLKLLKKSEK